MTWLDHYPPAIHGVVQQLLGCQWGRGLAATDEPCPEQADGMVMLHVEGSESDTIAVKLCDHHIEAIKAETEPHTS